MPTDLFPRAESKLQVWVSAVNSFEFGLLGVWEKLPLCAKYTTGKSFFHLGSHLIFSSYPGCTLKNLINDYFFARPLAATLCDQKITLSLLCFPSSLGYSEWYKSLKLPRALRSLAYVYFQDAALFLLPFFFFLWILIIYNLMLEQEALWKINILI